MSHKNNRGIKQAKTKRNEVYLQHFLDALRDQDLVGTVNEEKGVVEISTKEDTNAILVNRSLSDFDYDN
jgi:hypothetical protein